MGIFRGNAAKGATHDVGVHPDSSALDHEEFGGAKRHEALVHNARIDRHLVECLAALRLVMPRCELREPDFRLSRRFSCCNTRDGARVPHRHVSILAFSFCSTALVAPRFGGCLEFLAGLGVEGKKA